VTAGGIVYYYFYFRSYLLQPGDSAGGDADRGPATWRNGGCSAPAGQSALKDLQGNNAPSSFDKEAFTINLRAP